MSGRPMGGYGTTLRGDSFLLAGHTPLVIAVMTGDNDAVQRLLSTGADPNELDQRDDYPLGQAIAQRNLPAVRLLMNKGAQLRSDRGRSEHPTPEIQAIIDEVLARRAALADQRAASISASIDDRMQSLTEDGDLSRLFEELESSHPYTREQALNALTALEADETEINFHKAIGELKDDDEAVRQAAIYSLASLGDKRAAGPLASRYKYEKLYCKKDYRGIEDYTLCISILKALAKLGDESTVATFCDELSGFSDESWYYTYASDDGAITGYRERQQPQVDITLALIEMLGNLGSQQAVDTLLVKLKTVYNPVLKDAIVVALKKLGKDEVELKYQRAVSELKDRKYKKRVAAAKALKELGDKRAIGPLLEQLTQESITETDYGVWFTIVDVLESFGRDRNEVQYQVLLSKFNTASIYVGAAARNLASLGDTRAAEPLLNCLLTGHPEAGRLLHDDQIAIVKALANIYVPSLTDRLLSLYEQESYPELRVAIIETLASSNDQRIIDPLVKGYVGYGRKYINPELLRNAIVDALTKLGVDQNERDYLNSVMLLEDDRQRAAAAKSLGDLADPRAAEYLISFLSVENQNEETMVAIIEALGKIGDSSAIVDLKPKVKTGNYCFCLWRATPIAGAAKEAIRAIETTAATKRQATELAETPGVTVM